jgi:dihydrolipoamide dehydrogenase
LRDFDIIVIGSGSGLDVAVAAASNGLRVAVVEKDALGGTCLNRGCIPSKMLIHSADIALTIRNAVVFGISVSGLAIDFPAIVKRVSDEVDSESKEIENSFKGTENPKLYKTECRFVGVKTLQVGGETIRAERILIATGTRPKIPGIKGLKESGFITSDEALKLMVQPKSLTIIGGGYIAAELAHFFGALGSKISIIQRGKYLVPNEDEEVAALFTQLMSSRYDVYTGYEPIEVSKSEGIYRVKIANQRENVFKELESDQLLVATGRTPNSDLLDLEKTGVKTSERGHVVTDEYLETTQKGIFALGDAVGRFPFKHTANHEAAYAYNNLIQSEARIPVDYTAMPHAIFTSPQIAGVGKTEQQLISEKKQYFVGKWRYYDTGMGKAIEDSTGFVKLLLDKESLHILGCHIMGTDASTIIHEVLVAMKAGDGTANSITNVVHIHPALPEVIKRAAENIYDPSHHHEHTYR